MINQDHLNRQHKDGQQGTIHNTKDLADKIRTIATRIYHAGSVEFTTVAERQLEEYESLGFGHLPVCIAKTQYSFSVDSSVKGAPMAMLSLTDQKNR